MIQNSRTHYGWVSILLHWAMAIAFIALFLLGIYMVDLDYYDEWYHRAPELHKSVGIVLLLAMLFRFFWNHIQARPESLAGSRKSEFAARLTHLLFYLAVIALFLTGYMISTAEGQGIQVFNWFSVPVVLAEDNERADWAGDIHELLAYAFMALVLVHAVAAMYHHFIIKDFTLRRMLGLKQPQKP